MSCSYMYVAMKAFNFQISESNFTNMFITLEYGFCKCEFQVLAYKYFFNDFNKESHFTFLVFVYHV